jgi:hypothetical protein
MGSDGSFYVFVSVFGYECVVFSAQWPFSIFLLLSFCSVSTVNALLTADEDEKLQGYLVPGTFL